ncbi:TolC family protein [Plastoroseomonas arctica]|uniref:TolC family protein n=1 Tax=Plastoroseomonas arctica TaxID=1509237 RepID=A0AAF1JWS9_9PROT|nr:TolC family protein [Plastoroseomonas arctica]MBR0655504.1 TolC family protein [Plastoroseomonas arctica]
MRSLLLALPLMLGMQAPSAATDLRSGFAAAVELNAEIRSLTAQRDVIAARRSGSEALLPGAPTLSPSWRTQVNPQRSGYQEFEVGVDAPIWLPGESRALRGSVTAQEQQWEARLRQARITVAGEVRDAYWAWGLALAEREAARARLAAARLLERDMGRQAAGGNAPRTDLLVAQADARDAEGTLRIADGQVRDAVLAFRALTGRDPRSGPSESVARASIPGAALRDLPQAAVAATSLVLARAEERLAQVRDRASPTLFAGYRREREAFGERWVDRPMIGIRIPFTYGPQVEERAAMARAEAMSAEAQLATIARTFESTERRARAQREDAEALTGLTEQRYRALAEQTGLIETAFRAGNVTFIEVARARAQLAQADAARRRTRVERDRAASVINQILGVEP